MKQKLTPHRRAAGLLLAAAALPLNPALAQDVTTAPAQPPIVDIAPPPVAAPEPDVAPAVPPADAPAPAATIPAPTVEPVVTESATAQTRTQTRVINTRRTPAAARTATAETTRAPAQAAPAPAPVNAPLAAAPAESIASPAPAPAPAPIAEAPPTPAQPVQDSRVSVWPWLLGALVLLGAATLLMRRRRRDEEVYYEEEVDEPEIVAAPVLAAHSEEDRIAPPAIAPEVAAAAVESGRPSIALEMRPVRAGVNAEDAVVEFELTVDNRGTAAARDVRISTWMFPAGHASEAERALIESRDDADLPPVTIASGAAKRIDASVALPTARISEDAVLPVVVAEAHYRLPDGTEAQTTAAFEVGVQVDDDLAHFDVEHPSGLHDDVVARPHRESIDA